MIVIADASCLITLDNINETGLLRRLHESVFVTPEVADEVGDSLPVWVQRKSSSNQTLINELCTNLEIGEATSIALALEIKDCLLIIDEKKGRRTAKQFGIKVTGTFGIILEGIENGLIAAPDTIVERLELAGFHLSDNLKGILSAKAN